MTHEQLKKIAANAHALIRLKQESGFQTRRAVVELFQGLTSQELIEVSNMIAAMNATQGAKSDEPSHK